MPRGITNNNPGNIRKNSTQWEGLAGVQDDPSFFKFICAFYGLRCLARTLINYQERKGLKTLRQILSVYAPESDNPAADYEAIMVKKAKIMGVGLDENMVVRDHITALVKLIVLNENGVQPYGDELIENAIQSAKS